jgi:hypothetical protein
MGRATKTEIRDILKNLKEQVRILETAVTEDNGISVVNSLHALEELVEQTREELEDRYEETFIELEGEDVDEDEEDEED